MAVVATHVSCVIVAANARYDSARTSVVLSVLTVVVCTAPVTVRTPDDAFSSYNFATPSFGLLGTVSCLFAPAIVMILKALLENSSALTLRTLNAPQPLDHYYKGTIRVL